jgi:hypothetical protein
VRLTQGEFYPTSQSSERLSLSAYHLGMASTNEFHFPRFNNGYVKGRNFNNGFVVYGPNTHQEVNSYIEPNRFTLILFDSKINIDLYELGFKWDMQIAVSSEPNISEVKKIVKSLPMSPCNVVAFGGGSTMDLAKGIVCARHFPNDIRVGYDVSGDVTSRIEPAYDFLTVIPTTVGSGSEASRSCVLVHQNRKLASRAWQAVPRVIVIDPILLSYLTPEVAKIQLFDCWSHLTEVSLSNSEYSPFNIFAVEEAKKSLMNFIKSDANINSTESLLQLQVFSYIGGSAISNTRTGALHTIGEALASQIKMPHIWSLFFSALNWQNLTKGNLRTNDNYFTHDSLEKITSTLSDLEYWLPFLENSSHNQLRLNIEEIEAFNLAEFEQIVFADKVLWNKEHPVVLQEKVIRNYLEQTIDGIKNFGQKF